MAEVLTRAEASALATAAFEGTGVAPGPAAAAAEVLVIAEMMGIATHGLKRVPAYGRRLDAGGIDATARIEVAAPLPAIRMIDGRGGLGPAVAARALDEAVAAARSSGIAIALCRRSNHLGPLAPYLWRAAERGVATIAMSTAMAMMAPTGGREARLGNNPLGIGVPDPGGRHVLLDMALSVAARSHIREAAAAGRPIPPGWATDAAGRPTEDAAAALAGLVLPAGGYKGYGLAAAVDLFAGVLAGAASLTAIADIAGAPDARQDLGHAFIAIDTAALAPEAERRARLATFRRTLEETPPVDPAVPVRLPGDRALAALARAEVEGLSLDPALLAAIRRMADR